MPWLTGACVDVVCSVSHVRPTNPRGHLHLNGIGSPIMSTHVPPFRHGLQLQTPWLTDAVCVGACVVIVVDDDDGGDGGWVVTDGGGVVIDGFVDAAFVVENSFVVDGGSAVFSLLFRPFFSLLFFSLLWGFGAGKFKLFKKLKIKYDLKMTIWG